MNEKREVTVYKSTPFSKIFKKLTRQNKKVVEDEIDLIIKTPTLGEEKKGDLSHLRVHKFELNKQEVLLGYSWREEQLEIWLLNLGSHENFYDNAKNRRGTDLNLVNSK